MVPLLHSLLLAPSSYFKPKAHPSSSSKLSRAPQRSECPFYGSPLALAPDRRPSELGWISRPRVCFYHSYSIFTRGHSVGSMLQVGLGPKSYPYISADFTPSVVGNRWTGKCEGQGLAASKEVSPFRSLPCVSTLSQAG